MGVSNSLNTGALITLGGTLTTAGAHTLSGAFASTFTFTNTTSVTFPTSGTLATTSQLPTLPLSPTDGGTGLSNPTAHGILVSEGSSNFNPIVLSSGQILIGSTGVDPVAAAIGSGAGILVGNGAGSITVSNTGVLSNIATSGQTTVSGATGNVTIGLASNAVLPGTGGVTLPTGNTAARAGILGTIRFNSQTTVFEGTVDGATWTTFASTGGATIPSVVQGDTLYASATNVLSALAKDTNATRYLSNTGTSNNPAWAQVALTTGVSGILPSANGGTGVNNGASTITIGGSHTLSGAFTSTFTFTNTTSVTFPTSGTLATTSQLGIVTLNGDSGSATGTTVTINGGTTGLTTSASSATMSLTGTLIAVNGGTGVTNSSGSLVALGLADSGVANAYAVTISPAPGAYATGQTISFIAAHANTAASTLKINSLATKAITKYGATALVSGDIAANQLVTVVYDGTQFQLQNPVATAGTGSVTSVGYATGNSAALTLSGTASPITTSGSFTFTPHGNLMSKTVLTSGSSATYTVPSNVNTIFVECVGGGAGGGGITCDGTHSTQGGGGGSGGYCNKLISTSPASTFTYTVGASAAGGVGNNTGTAGNNTSFGTLTANGGTGGTGAGATTPNVIAGGGGGGASGGDINIAGCSGNPGIVINGVTIGGYGGNSILGGCGQGSITPSAGVTAGGSAGTNTGSGGGGASGTTSASSANGGAGGAGLIVVWEYA